jgi:hypothetical protein
VVLILFGESKMGKVNAANSQSAMNQAETNKYQKPESMASFEYSILKIGKELGGIMSKIPNKNISDSGKKIFNGSLEEQKLLIKNGLNPNHIKDYYKGFVTGLRDSLGLKDFK